MTRDDMVFVMSQWAMGSPDEFIEVPDGPGPRCIRCDTSTPGGEQFCQPCRADTWEWAQSWGGSKDEIETRVSRRFREFREYVGVA